MSDDTTPPAPAESTASAAPPPAPVAAPVPRPASREKIRTRLFTLGGVAAGMVLGAVVEMFVQGAMESTGWFGPTLDNVINEQVANFTAVQEKLDALAAAKDDVDRARIQKELEVLLREQEKLTARTHSELRDYQQQVSTLKADALKTSGAVGGADVWLSAGQSITVGSRENVFSLQRIDAYRRAHVNLSGKTSVMSPGDIVEASVGDKVWKVFYKQSTRGEDRTQLGFDVVPPDK